MTTELAHRYPAVHHFMTTVLLGDGTLEDELVDYVKGVSRPEVARSLVADVRTLLAEADVSDDDLDTFVLDNAFRFVGGSGRRTLEHVAERLQHLLEHPPPAHPLTDRAPTLAAFLGRYTSRRGVFDDLVRAGAAAAGPEVAARAAEEGTALLRDPEIPDVELNRFVREHSWWFLDNSGRRTIDQAVAGLGRPAGPLVHDEAKALAEIHLDEVIRPHHDDEVVIVDRHTQESDTTWAFVYNSRAYVETGDFLDMIVGNAPVLVDKATGHTRSGRSDLSVAEQL